LHERRIVDEPNPVINALDTYNIQCFTDEFDGTFLARMSSETQTLLRGLLKDLFEQMWRISKLRRIKSYAFDHTGRIGRLDIWIQERRHAICHRQVPEKARDEFRRNAQLSLSMRTSSLEPRQDGLIRNATARVRLRVEEDFGMLHTVGRCMFEVVPRQRFEVGFVH
jgi:hypothetical protein